MRWLLTAAATITTGVLAIPAILVLVIAAPSAAQCAPGGPPAADVQEAAAKYGPMLNDVAARYGLDGQALILKTIRGESHGNPNAVSKAGARGIAQFMPGTRAYVLRRYGIDPWGSTDDAIHALVLHLRGDLGHQPGLEGYNPGDPAYTAYILRQNVGPVSPVGDGPPAADCAPIDAGANTVGPLPGPWLGPVPGQPGGLCDRRILPDVAHLIRRYHVAVSDCWATSGHAADGEHPLGLAVDLGPGPGGTWDDVDALARRAEPAQNHPRPPFRWVGYDGDPNHGRGDHLHLSWRHGPGKPAETVQTFTTGDHP